VGGATFGERRDQGVAFIVDLTDRKRAEELARQRERQYHEIQIELAHANRVATMGHLTASIAHEVSQPMTGALANAQTALLQLRAQPPDLERMQQALARIVRDMNRAGDVIGRIRELVKNAPPRRDSVHVNDAIREVIELTRTEAVKNGISVRTEFTDALPLIEGDRVQLQQVMLNLIVNAIQAMSADVDGVRGLLITTAQAEPNGVLVAVRDSGPSLAPDGLKRIFDPFYSTKPGGLGMGLSICRSIIEAHDGRLWVNANQPRGAIFYFTLPAWSGGAS
jgi:signal transduction histidine kinase